MGKVRKWFDIIQREQYKKFRTGWSVLDMIPGFSGYLTAGCIFLQTVFSKKYRRGANPGAAMKKVKGHDTRFVRTPMQVLDEKKRLKILGVAAELFASQPFHKVLLSDVAEAAAVGKGTLYTYFKSKEDLYLSVIYSGFEGLVERLRERIDENAQSPLKNLETVIIEIVHFAYQSPHVFEVMRTVSGRGAIDQAKWDEKRRELKGLIESIIRRGIRLGTFRDPHPQLTARFIPGLVRSIMIDGTDSVDRQILTEHILRFVRAALLKKGGRL